MSHHTPYYAQAPLGQDLPVVPASTSLAFGGTAATLWRVVGTAAGAALAYHGYKRNNSVGWALAWAIFGGMFWPVGLGVAYAQGFGKPATMRANRRRRRRSR